MMIKLESHPLLIRMTSYPSSRSRVSLISAASFLCLPHLSVESISMQILPTIKSMMYTSIWHCVKYLTFLWFKILAKAISCGSNFFLYVSAVARCFLTNVSWSAQGLNCFIRSLWDLAHSDDSLRKPHAQWSLPLFFVNWVAHWMSRKFNSNRLAWRWNVSRLTPHSSLRDLIERASAQCRFLMVSVKDIPKCDSIFSNPGRYSIDMSYNCRRAACQE